MIRITWKDTNGRSCPPMTYRHVLVTRYKNGWTINFKNNTNIYASQDCAKNAIDLLLSGSSIRNSETRRKKGIKIIGKIE